jgi:hypothetical protein
MTIAPPAAADPTPAAATASEPARIPCASALDAVRAFGVAFGGPAVLDVAALAATGLAVRALARRRRPSGPLIAGAVAPAVYAAAVVPWMRGWGATETERSRALPADELIPHPGVESTRAVTIDAPVEEVWPWLAQLGQDRGGFYSYEWLENLAGCRMHNADRVHPEWQERQVGEPVMLHWAHGTPVTRFEPGRLLALGDWGAFVLEPLGAGRTRLLARGRTPRGLAALVYVLLVELPHFVMERRMLLGIKDRVERSREA